MNTRLLTGAAFLFAVPVLVASPAHAGPPVAGCPPEGGWFAIQLGDIPEIPAALFEGSDFNEDGTLCAKVLPASDNAPGAPTGVVIDNAVRGGN